MAERDEQEPQADQTKPTPLDLELEGFERDQGFTIGRASEPPPQAPQPPGADPDLDLLLEGFEREQGFTIGRPSEPITEEALTQTTPPGPEPQDGELPPRPFPITIDGINYPCSEWGTVEDARVLERRYNEGFNGGMGSFQESQAFRRSQIYTCVNIDPTTYPYIRMRPGERDQTALTLTSGNTDKPAYGFVAEDSGHVEYLYIVNADRSFKIDLGASGAGTPALETTTQPSAGSGDFADGYVGRPVRFENAWYVPLGAGTNALKLTATAAGDQAGDTWADVGVTALHFATMMNEGVAQIWRADSTNQISGSADGTTFGSGFEVGDSSFAITDLLNLAGQLFVSKPDAPWRFDSQGVSKKIHDFVSATGASLTNFLGNDGACSGVFGPYGYWCHSTGLWRIFGENALPIDPFSQRDWSGIALDSLIPSYATNWFSFAAWQRWAYATNSNDGVYVGWIEADGTITWMGNILSGQGTAWGVKMRCGIVTTSTNPILWVMDTSERFAVFDLNWDGSLRQIRNAGSAVSERGGHNEQGQIWMPNTDLGESEKQKQMRLGWLTIDNNAYANVDVEMRVHRDRAATSTQAGSAITSADGSGHFEFVFTPGSSDTFYEAMLALRFDTTSTSVAVGPVTDIAFVDGGAGADTITQVAAGFGVFSTGERIRVSGSASNDGDYTIVSVVAATITLATGTLTAEGAGATVTITRIFYPATADLRIREMGMRAVTPHVYRALIPVSPEALRGFSLGVKDALKKLRDLKSSEAVDIREPTYNSTFTGYIRDVREVVIDSQHDQIGYALEVFIERWTL